MLRPAKSPGIKKQKHKKKSIQESQGCSLTAVYPPPPPPYHNSSSKATPTAYSAPSCCCSGVAAQPAHTQQLLCETQGSVSFFKLRKKPTGTHTHGYTYTRMHTQFPRQIRWITQELSALAADCHLASIPDQVMFFLWPHWKQMSCLGWWGVGGVLTLHVTQLTTRPGSSFLFNSSSLHLPSEQS